MHCMNSALVDLTYLAPPFNSKRQFQSLSGTSFRKADPNNYLLMHAMGPNVAGVIGSAIVAGYFIATLSSQ